MESSEFPTAQPADPTSQHWPYPPLLAIVETEWKKQKASQREAEGEEEEENDDSGKEMKTVREHRERNSVR